MSATLRVRVRLDTNEADLAGGARIVGNIYPVGDAGVARRNVVFPCGPRVAPALVEVEPGAYVVSAMLPSGALLTESVEVREGTETSVDLDATDAPYETHAWQYLVGNIEPSLVYHNSSVVPAPRSLGSRFSGAGTAAGPDTAPDTVPDAASDGTADGTAAVGTAGAYQAAGLRVSWIADPKDGSWSFESVLALTERAARTPAEQVAASPPWVVAGPDETDGMSHLFRFGPAGPAGAPQLTHGVRQFLVVELADAVHLVTLPSPWDGAQVEVLVNARQSPTGSAIAVTVRDQDVGAGLAYMARGALDAAATLFTGVESALFIDLQNPLAAVAAAYVLTGTDLANEPAHWDPWLETLRDLFGWMSDGALLWAWRRLRSARTEADLQLARDGLLEAFDRGVPVYTLGLSRLMDALSEFPDDPECAWRLRTARQLSWSVDMREPFVIVDLRGRAG